MTFTASHSPLVAPAGTTMLSVAEPALPSVARLSETPPGAGEIPLIPLALPGFTAVAEMFQTGAHPCAPATIQPRMVNFTVFVLVPVGAMVTQPGCNNWGSLISGVVFT